MLNNEGIKKKKYLILLAVALCLVFVFSLIASLIQSDFGNIAVSTVTFPTRDGQSIAADLYKPTSATRENKAPLMVVVPGFQRSRETQSGIALEFARRGMVVINIDPYSQGDSSSSEGVESGAIASSEGYGAFDIINYVYDTDILKYVDINKIAITGHSAGGNAAYQAAVTFGKLAASTGKNKLKAAYISGYVLCIDGSIDNVKCNMGMDYALYDEGAFRNKEVNGIRPSDMTIAIESHDFVNSIFKGTDKIANTTPLEMGKIYGNPNKVEGSISNGTMRQVFNTATIHALQPYDATANTSQLSFFEIALDLEYDIPADFHIWWLKELCTTIALIGAFMFIVPFAMLLCKIPFFTSATCPVPAPQAKRTAREKIIFWVVFVLSATIAGLSYIPISRYTAVFFPDATNSIMTWWFPQRMSNAVLLWAVFNGILGMAIFLGSFYGLFGCKKLLYKWSLKPQTALADGSVKPNNFKTFVLKTFGSAQPAALSIEPWGLKIKPYNLFKTFLMSLLVVGGFYFLVDISYFLFHVDFRFLFIVAVRPLNLKVFLQALMYVPLFFIFYLSNSIRVNGSMREEGQKEWVSLLIAGLANTLGLVLILAIQYITFAATGVVMWTEDIVMTQWLYVNILFGLIPVMFILPFFNRWFFRVTGKSWLGPMVTCMIFITMMLNSSVAYIPLP